MVNSRREWTTTFVLTLVIGGLFILALAHSHSAPSTTYITYEAQPSILTQLTPTTIAKELLTAKSFKCWKAITTAESHTNPNAKNPNSSARGIGQLLSETYASLGMKYSPDGTTQLVAQLAYINRRFGKPNAICNAWAYHKSHGNY